MRICPTAKVTFSKSTEKNSKLKEMEDNRREVEQRIEKMTVFVKKNLEKIDRQTQFKMKNGLFIEKVSL